MNQTIIEVKLSCDSKERATELIRLLQAMSSGTKDKQVPVSFHSTVENHVNIISAAYRERREQD